MSCHDIGRGMNSVANVVLDLYESGQIDNSPTLLKHTLQPCLEKQKKSEDFLIDSQKNKMDVIAHPFKSKNSDVGRIVETDGGSEHTGFEVQISFENDLLTLTRSAQMIKPCTSRKARIKN